MLSRNCFRLRCCRKSRQMLYNFLIISISSTVATIMKKMEATVIPSPLLFQSKLIWISLKPLSVSQWTLASSPTTFGLLSPPPMVYDRCMRRNCELFFVSDRFKVRLLQLDVRCVEECFETFLMNDLVFVVISVCSEGICGRHHNSGQCSA